MPLLEHIPDQTVGLSLVQMFTFTCDNSSSILSTVLEDGQPIIDDGCHRLANLGDDANDTTHSATQLVVTWEGFRV